MPTKESVKQYMLFGILGMMLVMLLAVRLTPVHAADHSVDCECSTHTETETGTVSDILVSSKPLRSRIITKSVQVTWNQSQPLCCPMGTCSDRWACTQHIRLVTTYPIIGDRCMWTKTVRTRLSSCPSCTCKHGTP